MNDLDKSKDRLLDESRELRQRISKLEAEVTERREAGGESDDHRLRGLFVGSVPLDRESPAFWLGSFHGQESNWR